MAGIDEFGQVINGTKLAAIIDRMMAPNRLILKVSYHISLRINTLTNPPDWGPSHVNQGEVTARLSS